ncbi:hypothetical protein Golomagni_02550, partial [Golovinomyces magnicellulatus]
MELRSSRKIESLKNKKYRPYSEVLSAEQCLSSFECQIEAVEWSIDLDMDNESVMLTLRGSNSIRLDKWQDWPLWYDQLKIWCERNEIWEDVNPEILEVQPVTQRPVAPSRPRELNNETRANFQVENAIYVNDLRVWKEKHLALKQLDENLKTTVGDHFKQHLMGQTTERAKLRSLFEKVKPSVASIKADLKAEYEILKKTPYGKSVTDYFFGWQLLSIKCQTREHCIFTTGEEEPSLALHETLQQIYPVTAIFRTNVVNDSINAGNVIKLADEIKSWQTFLQSKGIVKFPSKIVGDKNAAFSSATFQ